MKFKKRAYKKRTYVKKGTAQKALAIAKSVQRATRPEYKYFNTELDGAISNAGSVFKFFDIGNGDEQFQKIGKEITPIRLSGRVQIKMNTTADYNTLRLVLFRGRAENGTSYTVSGTSNFAILEGNAGGGSPSLFLAKKNRDNRMNTNILYDKIYHFSKNGNNNTILDWNFKMTGKVTFDENNSLGATNGGIYLLAISDQGTNMPSLLARFTLSFTDC